MLLSMQIAADYKGCNTSNQCSLAKGKISPDVKSNGKSKATWANRHRAFSKLRQKKVKRQNTYGNHHRLDHTYAASANFMSTPQTNVAAAEHSDDCTIIEDEISSHNWFHNSSLEMHENGIQLSIQDSAGSSDVSSDNSASLQVTGANGALKQYSRSRKISKDKIRFSPTLFAKQKITKTVQEDKKRLIAALALIQLAQS